MILLNNDEYITLDDLIHGRIINRVDTARVDKDSMSIPLRPGEGMDAITMLSNPAIRRFFEAV